MWGKLSRVWANLINVFVYLRHIVSHTVTVGAELPVASAAGYIHCRRANTWRTLTSYSAISSDGEHVVTEWHLEQPDSVFVYRWWCDAVSCSHSSSRGEDHLHHHWNYRSSRQLFRHQHFRIIHQNRRQGTGIVFLLLVLSVYNVMALYVLHGKSVTTIFYWDQTVTSGKA